MNNLHSRIKSARTGQALSQAGLAAATGVSQPTVANWETGSHVPRKGALRKIAAALQVDENWLLSGAQKKAQKTAQAYLARPIRHIPIYPWPAEGQKISEQVPDDYLPYPMENPGAFALIDYDDPSNRNRIMIFEAHKAPLSGNDICLWTDGTRTSTALFSEIAESSQIVGRLKTDIRAF